MTRLRAGWSALFGGLVLASTGALAVISRGKWSDPLIDSGREWIVPDAIARGELLYRDVVFWFGPLTPYLHAAFFRIFGSNFSTLVLAGCVSSVAALAALHLALRRVADPRTSALWTALAIPALVFMPSAGGSILGMGYRIWHAATVSLLSIVLVSGESRGARRLAVAGAVAALAALCRVEWGFAALSAAALVVVRRCGDEGRGRSVAALAAGFVTTFGGVWSFFVAHAGWRALLVDQPVFLANIPADTRGHVGLAGLRAWRAGSWNLLYSASVWIGILLALELLALRREDPGRTRQRLLALGAVLLTAAVSGAMGAVPGPVLFSAAPLICVFAMVQGWRGGPGSRSSALLGFGWMGLAASHRRIFFIDDAPYVAPPLLLAFVCAAGLVYGEVRKAGSPAQRRRLEVAVAAALAVLLVFAFLGRARFYASEQRVPIPGTNAMLSDRPDRAREIEKVAETIREQTPPGGGLVVIPEGEVLNFLSGRANPIRHKLYLPGYLADANEADVVAELAAAKPAAIVLWLRPTGEYDRGLFGRDYGEGVAAWIHAHYVAAPPGVGERSRANPTFTLYLPRSRSPAGGFALH